MKEIDTFLSQFQILNLIKIIMYLYENVGYSYYY